MTSGANGDWAGTATPEIDEPALKEWIAYGLGRLEERLAAEWELDELDRKAKRRKRRKRD